MALSAAKRTNALTPAQLSAFHRDGYIILPGLLPPEQQEAMLEEAMDVWGVVKSKQHIDPASATWLQASLLPDIHRHSKLIREYFWRGPLVDIAEQLMDTPNLKGVMSQLTFKLKGNTKTFGWHQDNGYGCLSPMTAVSCLTALDDVDEENGCLRLIPQSHKDGQLRYLSAEQKYAQAELVIEGVDESKAIPVPMSAGDVLIMHCHCLHASGANTSGRHRRILFLRYADADAVEVYNDHKPRLGKLVKGRTIFPEVAAYEKDLGETKGEAQLGKQNKLGAVVLLGIVVVGVWAYWRGSPRLSPQAS
eukprot:TRINITY_DN73393_c0_g1_i1.p1 TRINITY_DN73393_c0_g1~~TRINITY_DN73393_c0_g1_i1.p1  ORF type:complete len:328 (-),score=50.20 TRINITY_DN73393_c0_g1_i1:120-1037(-)